MGFFGFFKRKKVMSEQKEIEVQKQQITKLQKNIHRQKIEYLQQKLERIKQQTEEQLLEEQIKDAEEDLYDDDDEVSQIADVVANPEDSLMNNLLSFGVQAMANRNKQQNTPTSTTPTKKVYSDDEIALIIANTPKDVIQQIKGLPEPMLRNIINNKYPDADESSIVKTIQLIRNQ